MSTSDKSLFALSTMTVACALAFGTFTAHAADVDTETVHELNKVTVDEAVDKTGETVLTAAKLDVLPSATGTVTDAFRSESFIQFDRGSRNGALGAEITPPQISIRGSRNYENNFSINGLSNNNLISPSGWKSGTGPNETPTSDAQAVMISTELLDNVKVLSENVSAEYGDFTGGVIDATVRDARMDRWHVKAWTRHTRDAWAQQHWTEDDENITYPDTQNAIQKDFKRSTAGITLEGPLIDGKLGALISYEKNHSHTTVFNNFGTRGNAWIDSEAPGYSRNDECKSTRDQDTFLARVHTNPNNNFYVAGTLIYSPYEHSSVSGMGTNTDFDIEGGGLNFTLNTRANLSIGTWTNDFGFSKTEASRDSMMNHSYNWMYREEGYSNWINGYVSHWTGEKPNQTEVFDYFTASEGGQGDIDQTQEQYKFKSLLALNAFNIGNTKHTVRVGAEAVFTKVEGDYQGFIAYSDPTEWNSGITGEYSKNDGVIQGDQYQASRSIQRANHLNEDFLNVAAFVEDTISVDRFTIRPGVRINYDDLTDDVNVAPRFFANMDILNDGRFNVNIGLNRYYGSQVLADAIYAGSGWNSRIEQSRKIVDGKLVWEDGDKYSQKFNNLGELKTPYADEIVLGGSAVIDNTVFKLFAVKRDHKDQIRSQQSKNGEDFIRETTNGGETSYEGITFAIEKAFDLGAWGQHHCEFGVTWSDTKSNSYNWLDTWTMNNHYSHPRMGTWDYDLDYAYVDGKKTKLDDLNATNFNADWVITYNHNATFMENRLRADLLMRWESSSERLKDNGLWNPNGKPSSELENHYRSLTVVDQDNMFNADFSLAYDLIKTSNSTLTLNMDIFNVFDNKNLVNTTTLGNGDHYSMGRQFFLGMSYQY